MERQSILKSIPLALGSTWAASVCEMIRKDGRVVAGGWPGTLLEARGRVWQRVNAELARHRLPGLTEGELTEATDHAYAQAKSYWLEDARRCKLEARRAGG
jgi:hypothetical protein